MLKIGDTAPDFELNTDEGTTVKLSDLRGQRVILFFYPKADTPGCTRQACGFRDSFPRIESANAVIMGLSPDKPKALAKWRAKESLPYTLLSDPDHQVADAYGAWGEKTMFGSLYMGILRGHAVIDLDGKIEDIRIKISPEESVQYALEFLEQHQD